MTSEQAARLIDDTLALRATVDYDDDPGFIDYNYLVREAGVSNPQPDFGDPAAVDANLRQKDDVNTDETWSGRIAARHCARSVPSTRVTETPKRGSSVSTM